MLRNHKIKKPIIFFPVESTPRELDYKINLARLFCKEGLDIIIGYPPFIRDELKYKSYKGIFLEKGGNPDPSYYKALKDKGMLLFCLSDEGASHPAYSVTYAPAVETLKTMECIFLWGNFQMQDLIQRNKDVELTSKYKVTGYPGIEFSLPFYKEYHRALKPKNLPDSYILVNTNFASYNGCDMDEIKKAGITMSPETESMISDSYQTDEICFKSFYKSIIAIIESFPDQQFIVRPHPMEKKENYLRCFEKFKNVLVSKDGNVNQLISGAKLVIHSECTTALQSYLMGVPVISLAHPYKDMLRASWALSFGATPESIGEINRLINYALIHKALPSHIEALVNKNAAKTIEKMFGNIEQSAQNISTVMITQIRNHFKNFKPYQLHDSRTWYQKLKLSIRKLLPLYYKMPLATRLALIEYDKEDIRKRLSILDKMDNVSNVYDIKKIFPNTFYISKI